MTEQLQCKNCGELIPANYINMEKLLAVCPNCHALFDFDRKPRPKPERRKRKTPQNITLNHDKEKLEIIYRWYTPSNWVLAGIAVFWDSVMCFMVSVALSEGEFVALFCMSLHIAVGVMLAYAAITNFFNSTRIHVTPYEIIITHGPIPALRPYKQLDRRAIHQLYVKERVHRGKRGYTYWYDIHALTKSKSGYEEDEKLLIDLEKPEEALFMEQQIEYYLKIDDEAVPGEFRG